MAVMMEYCTENLQEVRKFL